MEFIEYNLMNYKKLREIEQIDNQPEQQSPTSFAPIRSIWSSIWSRGYLEDNL